MKITNDNREEVRSDWRPADGVVCVVLGSVALAGLGTRHAQPASRPSAMRAADLRKPNGHASPVPAGGKTGTDTFPVEEEFQDF